MLTMLLELPFQPLHFSDGENEAQRGTVICPQQKKSKGLLILRIWESLHRVPRHCHSCLRHVMGSSVAGGDLNIIGFHWVIPSKGIA